VLLIKKFLEARFANGTSLSQTVTELHDLHHRIVVMGAINDNKLFTGRPIRPPSVRHSNLVQQPQTHFRHGCST
jgi:hypothetical protein